MEKRLITIMADYGMGPYAWERPEHPESTHVGPNIADAVAGFPDSYGVPKTLTEAFASWVCEFERCALDKTFDWENFHRRGIALAKELRYTLGDEYVVVYLKPREDPNYRLMRKSIVKVGAPG
jgi:hypothetical protein